MHATTIATQPAWLSAAAQGIAAQPMTVPPSVAKRPGGPLREHWQVAGPSAPRIRGMKASLVRISLGLCTVAVFLCGLVASSVLAAEKVRLEPVATGLTAPMAMVQPQGDDRMFIAEQVGQVRILVDGNLLPEPFLDLDGRAIAPRTDFDHLGLLGLVFHPDFAENGKFYVAYTRPIAPNPIDYQAYFANQSAFAQRIWWSHTNVVSEFRVSESDPNVADPDSEVVISAIDWPQFNHPGHWIDIGPDGKLYISTGDGGYTNDSGIGHNEDIGNGQDLLSPHGKMLRLNLDGTVPMDNPFVDRSDALPEIWAYGLRHPWRCSFDTFDAGPVAVACYT